MLFFAAEAGAAICGGMLGEGAGLVASKINVVTSVKVNGLELGKPTTTQQWRKAFGENGVVTKVTHDYMDNDDNDNGMCTPHHEVTVNYQDKTIRLTMPWQYVSTEERITESEFKALKFSQDFVKQGGDWEALLSIDWKQNKFKDSLVVGKHAIKPNLSFEEFKKLFPLSAQQSLAARLDRWLE
jgi:hypothetical protein